MKPTATFVIILLSLFSVSANAEYEGLRFHVLLKLNDGNEIDCFVDRPMLNYYEDSIKDPTFLLRSLGYTLSPSESYIEYFTQIAEYEFASPYVNGQTLTVDQGLDYRKISKEEVASIELISLEVHETTNTLYCFIDKIEDTVGFGSKVIM